MPPRKRLPKEIDNLLEPTLSKGNEGEFTEGIRLFNREEYWEAHESWEEIWQTLGDEPEDDWEILLRGLIQLAAGLHGLSNGKIAGGTGNLMKALSKLQLHPREFLGLDLETLVSDLFESTDVPESLLNYQLVRRRG